MRRLQDCHHYCVNIKSHQRETKTKQRGFGISYVLISEFQVTFQLLESRLNSPPGAIEFGNL